MRIRVPLNIGTNDAPLPPLTEGEHDVEEDVGSALVKAGRAIDLTPPPKIEAVPPPPTIAAEGIVEKAAADVKTYRDKTSRETKPSK